MKKNMLQKIKGIILGLVLVLGISVAMASWAPPAGTPSASNNEKAPLNVGTVDQIKDAGLIVNSFVASENSSLVGDATIGDSTLGIYSNFKIAKLSQANPVNDAVDYTSPVSVCADSAGTLTLCAVGTISGPTVNFTINGGASTQTIVETANQITPSSHPVTLVWGLANTTGSTTCTASAKLKNSGTANSSSVGWTGSKSIAGGTSSGVTINKFGPTEYKLVCDKDGSGATTNDITTATVTATLNGSLSYTLASSTSSGTLTVSNFNNITSFNISKIQGAGGAGAGNGTNGTAGVDTVFGTVNAHGGVGGNGSGSGGTGGAGGLVTGATGSAGTGGNAYTTVSNQGCGGVTVNSGNYALTPPSNTLCGTKAASEGFGGDGDVPHGGGGGGAGGYYTNSSFANSGSAITYSVGAGGATTGLTNSKGGNGSLVVSW